DRLAQIEPAPRDRDDGLVVVDKDRRAFRQIGAQKAPHRGAADAEEESADRLLAQREGQRHQPLVVKDELRRVEQIHARLLGDLRLAGGGAAEIRPERSQGAVMPRAAVEIDNKDGRAERVGMAQRAQTRAGAEIVGDQLAQMRVAGSRHYAAAGSAPDIASSATVSANWP